MSQDDQIFTKNVISAFEKKFEQGFSCTTGLSFKCLLKLVGSFKCITYLHVLEMRPFSKIHEHFQCVVLLEKQIHQFFSPKGKLKMIHFVEESPTAAGHDQLKQALACLADQLPSSAPYRTCPAVAAVAVAAHWAQKCN